MDISKETEIILRDNGYNTWQWTDSSQSVICFENESILGFIHIVSGCMEIIDKWRAIQDVTLARFKPELKKAGEKAWNVYSIFLTEGRADTQTKNMLNSIEENFQLTRKIVRAGINSQQQLIGALLPLLSIRNKPIFDESNFDEKLFTNLSKLHVEGAKAFTKNIKPRDIAQILSENS